MSHYKLLEIERTASNDDIRNAYKELVLQAHPDKGGSAQMFKRLQDAYEVLRDPSKRKEYDEKLREIAAARRFVKSAAYPNPLSSVKNPCSFALMNGDMYVFETAVDRLKSRFRPGDIVCNKKDESGCIIGLASNGIYWRRDGDSFASLLFSPGGFCGDDGITLLFKGASSATGVGSLSGTLNGSSASIGGVGRASSMGPTTPSRTNRSSPSSASVQQMPTGTETNGKSESSTATPSTARQQRAAAGTTSPVPASTVRTTFSKRTSTTTTASATGEQAIGPADKEPTIAPTTATMATPRKSAPISSSDKKPVGGGLRGTSGIGLTPPPSTARGRNPSSSPSASTAIRRTNSATPASSSSSALFPSRRSHADPHNLSVGSSDTTPKKRSLSTNSTNVTPRTTGGSSLLSARGAGTSPGSSTARRSPSSSFNTSSTSATGGAALSTTAQERRDNIRAARLAQVTKALASTEKLEEDKRTEINEEVGAHFDSFFMGLTIWKERPSVHPRTCIPFSSALRCFSIVDKLTRVLPSAASSVRSPSSHGVPSSSSQKRSLSSSSRQTSAALLASPRAGAARAPSSTSRGSGVSMLHAPTASSASRSLSGSSARPTATNAGARDRSRTPTTKTMLDVSASGGVLRRAASQQPSRLNASSATSGAASVSTPGRQPSSTASSASPRETRSVTKSTPLQRVSSSTARLSTGAPTSSPRRAGGTTVQRNVSPSVARQTSAVTDTSSSKGSAGAKSPARATTSTASTPTTASLVSPLASRAKPSSVCSSTLGQRSSVSTASTGSTNVRTAAAASQRAPPPPVTSQKFGRASHLHQPLSSSSARLNMTASSPASASETPKSLPLIFDAPPVPNFAKNHEVEKEVISTLRGDSQVVEIDPQESGNERQTRDRDEGEQQHTEVHLHSDDEPPIKELTKEELMELYLGAKRNTCKPATGDEDEEGNGCTEGEEEPSAKRVLVGLPQDDDDDDSCTYKATNETATSNFRSTLLFSRNKDVPTLLGARKELESEEGQGGAVLPTTSLRSYRSATTATPVSAEGKSLSSASFSLTSNGLRSLAPPSSMGTSQRGTSGALSDATKTSIPMPMAPPPVIAPVFRRAGAPVASTTTTAEEYGFV